jgi:DNA excision repair protein ERCC-8
VSPHQSRITALEIDNSSEGRFLLSGSQDCTISVYDLSLLGSEHHLNRDDVEIVDGYGGSTCIENGAMGSLAQWRRKNRFRPIARSQRHFFTADEYQEQIHLDPLHVPCGHSHSITQVKWYPVDSGVFISSDSIGNILMWDTNSFTPVTCLKKGSSGSGGHMDAATSFLSPGIASIDLPKSPSCSHLLLAIGTIQSGRASHSKSRSTNSSHSNSLASRMHIDDRVVYLCDVKSGHMTHQLAGHGVGGIQVVQWSPIHEYILASGSRDGTIKLWDIRKSGSNACLITLDRESRSTTEVYFNSIQNSSSTSPIAGMTQTKMKKRRKRSTLVGPGDYSKVECSNYVQSHAGPISNLSFTPDGNNIVSVSVSDGLKLWDVQSGKGFGNLLQTKFTYPRPSVRTNSMIPLQITQQGNFKTATAWVGGRNMKLFGFSIHGDGGRANKILSGHLDEVTSIASQENAMRLFSGSSDGMILGYGNRNEFEPAND